MTWDFLVALLRCRMLSRYGQLPGTAGDLLTFAQVVSDSLPARAPTSTGLPDRESRLDDESGSRDKQQARYTPRIGLRRRFPHPDRASPAYGDCWRDFRRPEAVAGGP